MSYLCPDHQETLLYFVRMLRYVHIHFVLEQPYDIYHTWYKYQYCTLLYDRDKEILYIFIYGVQI